MHAQNKYAVLVAVNDYYDAPGIKNPRSLQGCVNDANALKGLLLNRFGFNPANIASLYNAKVTKKNFIDLMHTMLKKCKAGDALVFYFSGHGVWMDNDMNDGDSIKAGMSQAIVMSDLYSPNWDCLVKDETLKQVFNQFVDKRIIVTTILDCCYSANLMMQPFNTYWSPLPKPAATKTIYLREIPFTPVTEKPAGCSVDSLGNIIDSVDTDLDGVPDCKDWEIHTPPLSVTDSDGVRTEPISEEEFLALPDNYYDSSRFANDLINNDPEPSPVDTRSFNLRDNISMHIRATQARPSDRPNSGFLSLAGTSDRNKGLEITDETGIKHGAFTKALLMVYKKNPADLPVSKLRDSLTAYMLRQNYYQSPTYYSEPGRLKGNLIGISASGFSKTIRAVCTGNKSGIITIDKGWDAGIAKGNILTDVSVAGKHKIKIESVDNETATAIDKTRGLIKKGHILELSDSYTISGPLVKIYIPSAGFTPVSFTDFFNKKVTKWVKQNSYRDYHFWSSDKASTLVFLDDSVRSYKIANSPDLPGAGLTLFYVFLPIPSYITEACKNLLRKDQNIEIVDDKTKADYVLYLNYTKERPGHKKSFVFYFHPSLTKAEHQHDSRVFSLDHAEVSSITVTGKPLQNLSQKIYELAKKTIRYKTTAWMNTYERR
jgi:hypothetical protein